MNTGQFLDYMSSKAVKRVHQQIAMTLKALRLILKVAPELSAFWLTSLLIQGAVPAGIAALSKTCIDLLSHASLSQTEELQMLLYSAVALGSLMLVSILLQSLTQWLSLKQSELLHDHIAEQTLQKSMELDLAFYDSPSFHDSLHRAQDDAMHRPIELLQSLGNVLKNSVALISLLSLLIPYGPWVSLALLLSALPSLLVVLYSSAKHHTWHKDSTQRRRRKWYYNWLLAEKETAAEMRAFGLGDYFREQDSNLRRDLRKERLALAKEQYFAESLAGASSLGVTIIILSWSLFQNLHGSGTLGDLVLLFQVFRQGQAVSRSFLSNLGSFYRSNLFLRDYFEFLDLRSTVKSPENPEAIPTERINQITFQAVDFEYPEANRKVLQNFNLTLNTGKTTALIGENGSGKTTVIKLLSRLYDPLSGCIQLNGSNIQSLDLTEYRKLIGPLFQAPIEFSETFEKCISLGDTQRNISSKHLQQSLNVSGSKEILQQLAQGPHSLLGNEFEGGAELSKGQWQRLAYARALYRDAPIVILDEPTSALDPWAEKEWFSKLKSISEDKIVLIVTHRLSTAMYADNIAVLRAGTIKEQGTHQELMQAQGDYYEAFTSQSPHSDTASHFRSASKTSSL